MATSTRGGLRLRPGTLSLLALLGGCWDGGPTGVSKGPASPSIVLSDTSRIETDGALAARIDASREPASEVEVSYVSLAPGSVPDGASAVIANRRTQGSVTVPIVAGGFDPVPIGARAGDTVEATVHARETRQPTILLAAVPRRRAPTVVRTIPPRGKTYVPLNTRMSVVFSEPIDPASVGPTSLRLMRGSVEISGRIEVGDVRGVSLDFVPDTPLAAATNYRLAVSEGIRDRDGDAVDGPFAVEFTTEPPPQVSACPNYVDPTHCPPFSTHGSGIVSGIVSVRSGNGVEPLPNADVWGFVIMTTGNGFSLSPTKTDANGAYRRADLPDGFVVLYAAGDTYDQPCAATVTVRQAQPATSDIELVSQFDPRPELATASPSIRGTVYESTLDGRRPVAGARIYFELLPDLVTATTTTNAAGQYSLCRLPSGGLAAVTAAKDGYVTNGSAVVVASDDQVLDIKLTRQP